MSEINIQLDAREAIRTLKGMAAGYQAALDGVNRRKWRDSEKALAKIEWWKRIKSCEMAIQAIKTIELVAKEKEAEKELTK
jgi:hypothetical protein